MWPQIEFKTSWSKTRTLLAFSNYIQDRIVTEDSTMLGAAISLGAKVSYILSCTIFSARCVLNGYVWGGGGDNIRMRSV